MNEYLRALSYLPTTSSSVSVALLRKKRQRSIVKIVLAELNTDVRDETSAESATAIITPRIPVGSSSSSRVMYAKSEHPAAPFKEMRSVNDRPPVALHVL